MKRETLQSIFRFLLTRLARVEFCGLEHLPPSGPIIVATNHMSRMDTLYLFINPARPDITALVADKYQKYPVFNWILNTAGIIWLDRSKADFGAFRLAVDVLKGGVSLGIAPEGTRSTTGQLQAGKQGTALLALKAGVPVVPVGISGSEEYFRRLLTLRRPNLRLTFGPAIHLPPLDRDNREESLQKMTDEIMCRIAILLPEKYWGYYHDHPRLKEMLADPAPYR